MSSHYWLFLTSTVRISRIFFSLSSIAGPNGHDESDRKKSIMRNVHLLFFNCQHNSHSQVMVMSAGQRTLLARNKDNEAKKRLDGNYENSRLEELSHYDDDDDDDDDEDYERSMDDEMVTANRKKIIRMKQQQIDEKQHKLKMSSTIRPKLQNMHLIHRTVL
jgi:hypothetical protein